MERCAPKWKRGGEVGEHGRGKQVLLFAGDDYEDLELWVPKMRLAEAGFAPVVAGLAAQTRYLGKYGYPCVTDASVAEVRAEDYCGLVIPGGWMPDKLRRDACVCELTRQFAGTGKRVAAICHGGWIPSSAGVYRGVRATGSLGIRDDLLNAGALWEDREAVVDRHFVSSRAPADLPAFCRAMLAVLHAG